MSDAQENANARIRSSWDRNAGCWTDAVRSGALESRQLITDAAITEAVLDGGGVRVLDVGCGEGWLSRRLAGHGCDVVGFDASAELIGRAAEAGFARFMTLTYDELLSDPSRVGRGFDAVICNFSLLAEDVGPLLGALRGCTSTSGRLLIQTVHPVAVAGEHYEDGWREERFENLQGEWSPMPWFFRTLGSWIDVVHAAGWQIRECREPVHPVTGQPASLIIVAASAGKAST